MEHIVAAMTGSDLSAAAEDFHACMYVVRKEALADKDPVRLGGADLAQRPSEVCLPLGSVLWERLQESIQKVTLAQQSAAAAQHKSGKSGAGADGFFANGGPSSLVARLTGRSSSSSSAVTASGRQFTGQIGLCTFLLTAGDALMELGETTAAQELCYDAATRIAATQAACIQPALPTTAATGGSKANADGGDDAVLPQFTLNLEGATTASSSSSSLSSSSSSSSSSTSSSRAPDHATTRVAVVMHARSTFGAARALASRIANGQNALGGKGSPGAGDPQLRFELSIRSMVRQLDAVRRAMSFVLAEQKRTLAARCEAKHLSVNGGGGAAGKSADPLGAAEAAAAAGVLPGSQAGASLYWLVQNGASTLFSLADPLVVGGHGAQVTSHLAWAIMAVEACVELCTAKFLAWRITMYRTLVAAYISADAWGAADRAATRAEQAVVQLREDEAMDPPVPAGVERVLLRSHGDVRSMVLRVRVWKLLRDRETRAETMGGGAEETVEAIADALEQTEGLLGGTGVAAAAAEDGADADAPAPVGNVFFNYPGDSPVMGAGGAGGYGPESDPERRLRLAVCALCECAEQTVFDDGDDDDSNDNSCIDVLARTACLVAAIKRVEPVLARLEAGGALFPEVDEKAKKKKRKSKGDDTRPPPSLSLATHSNLARQAYELGQWHHCARLLFTFLLRCGAIKTDTSEEDAAAAEAELRVTFAEDLEIQHEEQGTRQDPEEIAAAVEAAVVEARAARLSMANMAANQHEPDVFTLFPGDAPEGSPEATTTLMLEVSEWVAEARLLDTLLQLEHPNEHDSARSPLANANEAAAGEAPEGDGDGNGGEPAPAASNAVANVAPTKPKPVVFDIGGQRFRVDTLKAVADALVVATTEASMQTPGGGLPYTRRELLVKIALGLWSPYAEAMLSELDELDQDESADPRLIAVALCCVDAVFVALTALNSGDVLFRAKVGLQVALLHEIGAESSGDLAGGVGARHLRSGVQAARQTLQLLRDERQRSVNLGWHLAGDISSQHQDNNNTGAFSAKEGDTEEKSDSPSPSSFSIDTEDPFTTHSSLDLLTRAAITATSKGDGNTYGSAVLSGVHPRNRLAQLDTYLSDLAAVHTDLVLAVTRLTLLQGASEHASHQKHAKIAAAKRSKKHEHGSASAPVATGALGLTLGSEFDADLAPAAFLPAASATESFLAEEAGFDGYVHAMQLISMASRHRNRVSDRVRLFEEAFAKLQQCRKDEAELCALAQAAQKESLDPHPKCMQVLPQPPVLVSRSSSSLTLRLSPFWRMEKSTHTVVKAAKNKGGGGGHGGGVKKSSARKDDKLGTLLPVAYFKVYGKPLGAGTSVSLNNTEYFGLGTEVAACVTGVAVASDPVIPGGGGMASTAGTGESPKKKMVGGMSPRAAAVAAASLVRYEPSDMGNGRGVPTLTVKGLLAGEAYVFAVAAYALDGSLIGNAIGPTSTVPFVCAVPLPLPICLSYLASAAARSEGCAEISKKVAAAVYDDFVDYHKDEPADDPFRMSQLHLRNPARAHRLIRPVVERAPLPVVQAFVRSVFTYLDMTAQLEDEANSSGKSAGPNSNSLAPPEGGAAGIIPNLSRSLLPLQVARLQSLQRSICAVEAARLIIIAPALGSPLTKNIDPRRPAAGADLVMEGVVRSYNLAEPLLKVSELGPHLLRTLVVLRSALSAVPRRQWYPVCQRLFARLAYEITRLGESTGETSVAKTALIDPAMDAINKLPGNLEDGDGAAVDPGVMSIAGAAPVKEQEALETALVASRSDFFKSGRAVIKEVAGTASENNGSSEEGGAADEDIEAAIWGALHGGADAANDVEQPAFESRLSVAYEMLCDGERFGRTHPRFLEMMCRLARLGLERGAHALIRSWLFQAPGAEEAGVFDEVAISTELASRLKEERARNQRAGERSAKRAVLREKRAARILEIKVAAREAARDASIEAGEELNDGEGDGVMVVDPEECTAFEFEDENDTLAYPVELSEEELALEEEDDQAAVAAGELPKILALDEFVQSCLCQEITDVPDCQAVLASTIEAVRLDYEEEQKLRKLAVEAKEAAAEAAVIAAETAEAAALAAASGAQDEDDDAEEDDEGERPPSPAYIAEQAKKRADELKLVADDAAAVAENMAPSTGLEKFFDGYNRTGGAAAGSQDAGAPPALSSRNSRSQLLWLSHLQLLRARVLFERLAQDGAHGEEPLMDFPPAFRVPMGNNETVNLAMKDALLCDPVTTMRSSAARSSGPLMDMSAVLPPDERLDQTTGDELVPKNPSATMLRRAARSFVDAEESGKKEQRRLHREQEAAAAAAAATAEEAGEDPEEAAAVAAAAAGVPALALGSANNMSRGFSINVTTAADSGMGGGIPMSARALSVAVGKRRRHREKRLLIREIVLLCTRAARRAAMGRHWATAQQCLKVCWNTLWLGWVCPLDFSSRRNGEARWREALRLAKIDWKRDDADRRQEERDDAARQEGDAGVGATTPANSRPSTAAFTARDGLASLINFDYLNVERSVELPWEPLCYGAHVLLDVVEAVHGSNELSDATDPNDVFTTPALDTTWIAQIVIFTMSVLVNIDERPAVLLLGRRLLNLTDNSVSVAERALPLMLHAQRQTWRRLAAKVATEKSRLDKHDAVWEKSEKARAKRRKRRLLTVGMRPEEKAYRDIRARLSSKLEGWLKLERREGEIHEELKKRLDNLLRDKSNSLESLDDAKRTLTARLDARYGIGGTGSGEDNASDIGSKSKNAGGGSTHRSSRSKASRASRAQRTARSKSGTGSSAGGGGGGSGASAFGGGSVRGSGKYELEYGEPSWVQRALKQFEKVISGLRTKRETSLLVEALDALGDFQATRGAGNVGRAAGLSGGSIPTDPGVPGANGELLSNEGFRTAHDGQRLALATVPNPRRRKAALKAWLDAVDALFGAVDVDRTWRSFTDGFGNTGAVGGAGGRNESKLNRDVSLLSKLGLWGCLRCGVVTAKSAQFCLQDEPGRQVDICLFSARVLGAPFASSLPHPVRPCDFATRTALVNERNRRTGSGGAAGMSAVQEGKRTDDASRANADERDYIWPGIQGLHFGLHREAPDPLQLLMCVRFVCGTLIKAGSVAGSGDGSSFGLACLAPLALAEHAAVCVGSVKHAFEIRMMRIGALRLCNRFREASSELAALLRGDRLPADLSAKPDPEPSEDEVVIVGAEEAAAVASGGGDEDRNAPGKESVTAVLASAVASRPGKGLGLPSVEEGEGGESLTSRSDEQGGTARSKAPATEGGTGGTDATGTARSGVGSLRIPRNMRPTTATFNEGPRVEADPFEIAPDDLLAVHSQLPLLHNDLQVTHSAQTPCLKWMMDIDRVRCPRRLRALVGRGLVRRLQVERCKLLMHFARAQSGAHKTTELVSEDSVLSIDDIMACVDEFACRLMQGCRDGTSLATWVRPAPPPPPPTPPDTVRSGGGMSARSTAAKNSARSTKSSARSGSGEDDEEQDEFPGARQPVVLPDLPPVYVFARAERRLNRMETHLLFACMLLRAECAAARRMFGNAAGFAQDLQRALADDANARMRDIERSNDMAEKATRAAAQEERLLREGGAGTGTGGGAVGVMRGGHRVVDPPGLMSSLGSTGLPIGMMGAIAEEDEPEEAQAGAIDPDTGLPLPPPQRHRPRVTITLMGNRPANADEERDPLLRPGLQLWLRARALRASAMLSTGDLDGAKEECDAGLAEARNFAAGSSDAAAAQERLVASHLGSMRAQIHTASGETEEALQVLQMTEQLLSVDASEAEDAEGNDAAHGGGGGHGGHGGAAEESSSDASSQLATLCAKDDFSPNPSGLIECLCLRGDLLVEISQAEDPVQQRVLQAEAMQCFLRASALSKAVLLKCGWDDQAGLGGVEGRGEAGKGEGGGFVAFARGPMACIWFPAVVLLAKSQIRVARTTAILQQAAADGSEGEEDALVAVAGARTALDGHVCGQPPTLLPTVTLFHGRFLRLALPRRAKSLSSPQFVANLTRVNSDSNNCCGAPAFDAVVATLEETVRSSIASGGHDHLLLRAALLELTALHGSRWVAASSLYDWEERHKRAASFYLRKAAEAASMYQVLRSEVQDIGSGDPLVAEELTGKVPSSVLRHIVEQQCRRKKEALGSDGDDPADVGDTAAAEAAASEASGSRPGSAAELEATALAYRPDAYASPREGESQKEADELSSCEISMRSILYYYLELLQQRRICEAAVNNDARAQSIVDIHNYLMENAPAYAERCCFAEPPLFSEPLPNGSAEEEGDEPAMDLVSVGEQFLFCFLFRIFAFLHFCLCMVRVCVCACVRVCVFVCLLLCFFVSLSAPYFMLTLLLVP